MHGVGNRPRRRRDRRDCNRKLVYVIELILGYFVHLVAAAVMVYIRARLVAEQEKLI